MKMAPRDTTVRDYGLALISRINRWLIAGAVGMAALLSLAAAHTFHGQTVNATGAAAPASSANTQPGGGLQQPPQAPAPASAAPNAAVSGGS
jgi:hypothetical protein